MVALTFSIAKADIDFDFESSGLRYAVSDADPTTVCVVAVSATEEYETFEIPSHVTHSGQTYSVTSIGWEGCKGLKAINVLLPHTLEDIGDFAFYENKYLKNARFGNNLRRIGMDAFKASALTSLVMPNSLTDIGAGAFWACLDLKTVTLGSGIERIGELAFYQCGEIEEIKCYASEPPYCGEECFNYTNSSLNLLVPPSSVDKYRSNIHWNYFSNIIALNNSQDDIVLSASSLHIPLNGTSMINVVSSTGRISWSSSDERVATVDNGLVTGISTGYAEITATAANGASASCSVWVVIPVTEVVTSTDKITMYKDDVAEASAYVLPENASSRFVWWESGNTAIAEVYTDLTGKVAVKGVNAGKTTITAKSDNDIRATIEVEVKTPVVPIKIQGCRESSFIINTIKGEDCAIQITPENDWTIHSLSFNGEIITEYLENNLITIPYIESGGCLNIVFEKRASNVSPKPGQENPIKITVSHNTVTIKNSTAGQPVKVYTPEGALFQTVTPILPATEFELPDGIYIIQHNNQTFKIII